MSNKGRMSVFVSVIVLFVCILSVSLVAVFASPAEPVVRNVDVTYNFKNVTGSISASYQYGNTTTGVYGEKVALTTTGNDLGDSLVRSYAEINVTSNKLLPQSDVILTEKNNSVIFEFNFTNIGPDAYGAALTCQNLNLDNCQIEFSKDGQTWGRNMQVVVNSVHDEGSQTSYYVRATAQNVIEPVEFDVNFVWTLVQVF